MSPADVLDALRDRGVEVVVAGDRLRFRPVEAVTPDLLDAIRQNKPALLELLAADNHAALVAEALRVFPRSLLVDDARWQAFLALAMRTWPEAPLESLVFSMAAALAEIISRFMVAGDAVGEARARHAWTCMAALEDSLRRRTTP